jgi:uncharacterized protein (DUF342 family)
MEMHKIYEYEWERYIRLDEYEKSTKLLRAEIRNLKDDLDRIEEIKDRERIKLRERIEGLEQELKDEKVKNKLLRMKK